MEIIVGSKMKVRGVYGQIPLKEVTVLEAPPESQLVRVEDADGYEYYVPRNRFLPAPQPRKPRKIGQRNPITGRIERISDEDVAVETLAAD